MADADTRFRDFDAADGEENGPATKFKLGGDTFEVDGGGLAIWPLIRLARSLSSADDELVVIEGFANFIRSIVSEDRADDLETALERSRMPVGRFMEMVHWLMEEDTGHPTEPSSTSQQQPRRAGRSSKAGSDSKASARAS